MAHRIALANGNWTTAGTWGVVDTTSILDSIANNTALTTSYVESQTFAPGAITIDAIAVKIATRAATASGTISIRLATGGVLVAGTEVTINVSDIPNGQTANLGMNGWILFKFAAPVLLLAATNYTVSAKTSSATQVNLYRNATAGNWSRMLRTTTTGAPGAGDSMFVLGEWTAAATVTARSVTMDETASTDYGSASTTLSSIGISVGGTLAYGVTAATNYVLRLSGLLDVYAGGTFTMGTSGSPIPRSGSAVLEFDCAADVDFGFRVFGTGVFRAWGQSRSSGKDIVQCLLNTDEAAAQTVLGVDTDTGWLNGDVIGIAGTNRNAPTEAETATLSGGAGASSITVTAGIANAHSGTSPTQAEVVLLTRNVIIRTVTAANVAYGQAVGATATSSGGTLDFGWVDFNGLGNNSANTAAAITLVGVATVTAQFCTFRNGEGSCVLTGTGTSSGTFTITLTDCIFYSPGPGSCCSVGSNSTTTAALTMTRCTYIGDTNTGNNGLANLQDDDMAFSFVDCHASDSPSAAVAITASWNYGKTRLFSGCVFHGVAGTSSGAISLSGTQISGLRIINSSFWRCNSSGTGPAAIFFNGPSAGDILISGCTFFGNAGGHISFTLAQAEGIIRNCSFSGDSTFSTPRAILFTAGTAKLRFANCTFGVVTGIRTAHTTAAFGSTSFASGTFEITLVNCNIADATEIETLLNTGVVGRSFWARQRSDQVTNTHSIFYPRLGTVAYDTVTFRTASPSQKMTPTLGSDEFKLRTRPFSVPVASGKVITFGAYVRKDSTYNGSAPRLILLANSALGVDDDVVLDTLSVGVDTWELLTGLSTPAAEEDGVLQVVVDCDGSAGNVYVDDLSASTN